MFDVKCSNCGEIYHVNEIHEGRKTKCRKCQEIVLLIENEDSYRKKTNNEDSYYEETNKKMLLTKKYLEIKTEEALKVLPICF